MATDSKSAAKVLQVQNVLYRNFAYGFSPTELAEATGFSASDITRYVQTLINENFAERIPETGRIRPSINHAQKAIGILASINMQKNKTDELINQLTLNGISNG
jgi:DNA-binding IclR family transcriptional regulator